MTPAVRRLLAERAQSNRLHGSRSQNSRGTFAGNCVASDTMVACETQIRTTLDFLAKFEYLG